MNKAQYLSTSADQGGNGLYPLSVQTLNFIQEQINLLQNLAQIGGKRYILMKPTAETDGIIIIDGEVLPLQATDNPGNGIRIEQMAEDILADGTTYKEARVRRYARYVKNYVKDTENLYSAAEFNNFATNLSLNSRFAEYSTLADEIQRRLPTVTGVFAKSQLDAVKENVRIHCRRGSVVINGADEYVVNVYRTGDSITQEQILPNMQSYKREYSATKEAWGNWTICSENLHIEVKIKNRTTVYVRHGVIPEGVQLVLLRKKRRSKHRRTGGAKTTNADYKGKRSKRSPKNQYVHYKGVVLSTGKPGEWYVPKCVSVADERDSALIGKELPSVCQDLIVFNDGREAMHVVNTNIWSYVYDANRRCPIHTKIGLQFASAGTGFKTSGGEMVQMKYRLWWHIEQGKQPYTLRGFSVE